MRRRSDPSLFDLGQAFACVEQPDRRDRVRDVDVHHARAQLAPLHLACGAHTLEAIDHFEQAVSIDPHFGWARHNLGTALAQKGRLDEAIDHFEQALRLDPVGRRLRRAERRQR